MTTVVAALRDGGSLPTDAAPRATVFAYADTAVANFEGTAADDEPIAIRTASAPDADTAESAKASTATVDDDPGAQATAIVVADAAVADLGDAEVRDDEIRDDEILAVGGEDDSDIDALAAFATAAGPSQDDEGDQAGRVEAARPAGMPTVIEVEAQAADVESGRQTTSVIDASGASVWVPTKDGLYFVIGSFGYLDNARRAAWVFAAVNPSIVSVQVKGRKMYRVVIGPFDDANKDIGERLLIALAEHHGRHARFFEHGGKGLSH